MQWTGPGSPLPVVGMSVPVMPVVAVMAVWGGIGQRDGVNGYDRLAAGQQQQSETNDG